MGLIQEVTLVGGVVLPEAYINIHSYYLEKHEITAQIYLKVYESHNSYLTGKSSVMGAVLPNIQPSDKIKHTVVDSDYTGHFSDAVLLPSNVSIEKQIYVYLKTLPDYAAALDQV